MEKIIFIVLSFITILNIGLGFSISCPDPTELDPCTCKPLAVGLHVMCADFNDINTLVHAFKILRDYEVKILLLHNLMLKEVLPRGLFRDLKISELGIEKSNLTFSQPAFKGLGESLLRLHISKHTVIKSTKDFAIARLTNLTELNIKKNPLGTVKDQWLNGKIPNVVSVTLDEDDITKIESKAFADLSLLQSFSIAGNRIRDVKRSMFPMPAQRLKEIDLSNNEIKSLPSDFFSEMDSLVKVVLSGNDLITLSEITWGKVWKQLKSVLLLGNNLICDSSLSWIAKKGWPYEVDAKCVAPSELVGKDLKEVYDYT